MQVSKSKSKGIIAAALFLATAAITGCNRDANVEEPEATASAPEITQRQAPSRAVSAPARTQPQAARNEDFRIMPQLDGALEEDGMGLDVIIDASSRQAYADSLEWISQDASKEQLDKLENAIRYLHMYDSSVLGSESNLLVVLDGKTGHEVVERAQELMNKRRRQN